MNENEAKIHLRDREIALLVMEIRSLKRSLRRSGEALRVASETMEKHGVHPWQTDSR